MKSIARPRVAYDTVLMAEDMAVKGWLGSDLAREAGVSTMAVSRFLRCERQTARMAKRLSRALGKPISRYLIRATSAQGAIA